MLDVNINSIRLITNNCEKELLNSIHFAIERGTINSILGKNGSGKSTLISSLTCLVDPRFIKVEGEVTYNGFNIFDMDTRSLQNLRMNIIRYVFQDSINIFDPLKTFEYYFKKTGAEIHQIDSYLDYFLLPGSREIFKMYPYEVSGGMAQRINLILAFLAEPKILFLDEPTSSTDIPIANLIKIKLKEYVKEKSTSVLIITQDIRFAFEVSDKIALISDETISKFYSTAEIFQSGEKFGFDEFKTKLENFKDC